MRIITSNTNMVWLATITERNFMSSLFEIRNNWGAHFKISDGSWLESLEWLECSLCEIHTKIIFTCHVLKWPLVWLLQMFWGLRWKREAVLISCTLEISVVFTEISTNTCWEKRELCKKCLEIKGQGSVYHILILYTDFSFLFNSSVCSHFLHEACYYGTWPKSWIEDTLFSITVMQHSTNAICRPCFNQYEYDIFVNRVKCIL
jgi:hypothetical protein